MFFFAVRPAKKQENPPEKSQTTRTTTDENNDNRKKDIPDDEDMVLSQAMDAHEDMVLSQAAESHENEVLSQIMDANEDESLSQALEELERSQISTGEPEPKVPRLEFKRPKKLLTLNLSRFKSAPPKPVSKENNVPTLSGIASTSVANEPVVEVESQAMNKSVKNRMLCTPSDDESSQSGQPKRRLPTKTLNLLNRFKFRENANKSQPLQQQNTHQQNIVAAGKSDASQPEQDSAYDTMIDSSLPSTGPPSCKRTGKTPALFPPSGETQNKIDEDDLSYLDTFEIT